MRCSVDDPARATTRAADAPDPRAPTREPPWPANRTATPAAPPLPRRTTGAVRRAAGLRMVRPPPVSSWLFEHVYSDLSSAPAASAGAAAPPGSAARPRST